MEAEKLVKARRNLGLTQAELAEKLGVSKNTIYNWENGSKIPLSKLPILGKFFNIDHVVPKNILDKSEDNNQTIMLMEPSSNSYTNKNGNTFIELSNGGFSLEVKVVPFEAHAKFVSEYVQNDAELFGDWETVTFVVDKIGRGNYLGFRCKGDSMNGGNILDTPDKAIVLARELGRQHWMDGFKPTDHGWIIVTKDNILFKDILSTDYENGTINCHSRNLSPEYCDFDYPLNDVRQIYKVIKRMF